MQLREPYLLFLGAAPDALSAKTASSILRWSPQKVLGQLRLEGCAINLDAAELTLEEAAARGAKSLIIGVANRGGVFEEAWRDVFLKAVTLGFDIVNGLHTPLASIPGLIEAAKKNGVQLIEIRKPTKAYPIATGKKRTGLRILTVGTDCSIGKMFTSVAFTRALQKAGFDVHFKATGQTGILVEGSGVPLDAIVADFMAGAIEELSPDAAPTHIDVIEGQSSLFHPSYAGVTLALIHGSQPDYIIMCHEPGRPHMRGLPHFQLPDLKLCVDKTLEAARLTNPAVKLLGIALNTSNLDETMRQKVMAETALKMGVPVCDPAFSVDGFVEALRQCM